MDDAAHLTASELEAIRQRWLRATPGPWKSWIERREQISGPSFISTAGEDIYLQGATDDDQDFIAAARQDVGLLLQEIALLRQRLARADGATK
jgi:hypothetical protein